VARVPASSGVLFPSHSGELESDGPRLEQLAPRTHPLFVCTSLLFLRVAMGFLMLQQIILECCNEIFGLL
jgi:hypothetical protein